MEERAFDADADPEETAAKLGLTAVQWHGPAFYARDKDNLYVIEKRTSGDPPASRLIVALVPPFQWYVGEEFHTPSQAAEHVGLTVIEKASGQDVYALDGFGRKYLVHATGNGPMAKHHDWATDDEFKKWAPRHRDSKPTTT